MRIYKVDIVKYLTIGKAKKLPFSSSLNKPNNNKKKKWINLLHVCCIINNKIDNLSTAKKGSYLYNYIHQIYYYYLYLILKFTWLHSHHPLRNSLHLYRPSSQFWMQCSPNMHRTSRRKLLNIFMSCEHSQNWEYKHS